MCPRGQRISSADIGEPQQAVNPRCHSTLISHYYDLHHRSPLLVYAGTIELVSRRPRQLKAGSLVDQTLFQSSAYCVHATRSFGSNPPLEA